MYSTLFLYCLDSAIEVNTLSFQCSYNDSQPPSLLYASSNNRLKYLAIVLTVNTFCNSAQLHNEAALNQKGGVESTSGKGPAGCHPEWRWLRRSNLGFCSNLNVRFGKEAGTTALNSTILLQNRYRMGCGCTWSPQPSQNFVVHSEGVEYWKSLNCDDTPTHIWCQKNLCAHVAHAQRSLSCLGHPHESSNGCAWHLSNSNYKVFGGEWVDEAFFKAMPTNIVQWQEDMPFVSGHQTLQLIPLTSWWIHWPPHCQVYNPLSGCYHCFYSRFSMRFMIPSIRSWDPTWVTHLGSTELSE